MSKRLFNYTVSVSFEIQCSFDESEVEQSEEGGEGDLSPTEAALAALAESVGEHLATRFGGVDKLEAWVDFDDLLGVVED